MLHNAKKESLPTFNSILCHSKVKSILYEAVVLPSKLPHVFVGIREPWKGVLMYGPPGTGKTQLAKAVASESNASFYYVSPSVLLSKYLGESEKMVRKLFEEAKAKNPSIIFFDEVDAIGCTRSSEMEASMRRVFAELLVQITNLSSRDSVILLGATNRIEDVDAALLRRFERKIYVGLLEADEREEFLRQKMAGTKCETSIEWKWIAKHTAGYSGADLELLCRDAAMYGIRELITSIQDQNTATDLNDLVPRSITHQDFEAALQTIVPSQQLQKNEKMF